MDFKEQLRRQLGFLDASCQLYDRGVVDEALRIAVSLRVMFHDTNTSKSLVLCHLGSKSIQLLSTCYLAPGNKPHPFGLVDMILSVTEGGKFFPRLEKAHRMEIVDFTTWWKKDVIFLLDERKTAVTRRDLILTAANKDGGAHVDSKYDDQYVKIMQGCSWKMTLNLPDGKSVDLPFRFAHLAALRQMGFEVLHSPFIKQILC